MFKVKFHFKIFFRFSSILRLAKLWLASHLLIFRKCINTKALNPWNRLTTCPVLDCAVRATDETSNRTIECPLLAQMINQSYILIIKYINQCGLVVRITDAMLSRVLINIESSKSLYVFNTRTLTQNFKVEKLQLCIFRDFVRKN